MLNKKLKPSWKVNAIHGAIALMVANTVYIQNATAGVSQPACASTIAVNQGACYALDASKTTINSGVTVSSTYGAAVVYPYRSGTYNSYNGTYAGNNLGNLAGSLTNKGTISAISNNSSGAVGVLIEGELTGTLTNSGTIQAVSNTTSSNAYAYGISENGSPAMSGTLTNTGTISATAHASSNGAHAYGVYVGSSISETGVLNNSGTISATATVNNSDYAVAYGVYIGNSLDGKLINSGTISAKASISGTASSPDAIARGVYVGNNLNGSFTNTGTISASASISAVDTSEGAYARAYGVYVGNSLAGSLTNRGTISATASFSGVEAYNSSGGANAYGVLIGGNLSGTMTNSGTISATATNTGLNSNSSLFANAYGVLVGGNLSGKLTNSGNISAVAINTGINTYSSIYAGAYGVHVSTLSGSLTNSGTISANATATGTTNNTNYARAYGVYVDNISTYNSYLSITSIAPSASASLTNSGTISATAVADANNGYARAYGVTVATLGTNGVINNSGTIKAMASAGNNFSSAAHAVGVKINNMNGGVLNNSGTISGAADGGEGYSLVVNNAFDSVINNNLGGMLLGNLYVYGGKGGVTLNNAGTIEIPIIADGGEGFAVRGHGYIYGDYNQSSTGLVALGAANSSLYSTFSVAGTANMTGSNQLAIHATPNNTLAVGDTLQDVFSATTWTGLASGAVVKVLGTPMFNFTGVEDGANHIDITVTSKKTIAEVLGGTGALGGLSGALDGLVGGYTGNGALDGLLNNLYATNTQAELEAAAKQLLPLLTTGTDGAVLNNLHGINRIIQARQESNEGLSSGDEFFGDRNFWLKPIGSWSNQDNRNNVSGYSASTFGLVFGADGTISDTTRVGAAFSYMHSNVDGNDAQNRQHANIGGYQAIVYGSHNLDETTEVSVQADIGLNQVKGSRYVSLALDTAKSDYDSYSAHIGAGLGRTYSLNEQTTFTPSVRADYTYLRNQGYTETGSVANLIVGSNKTDELIFAVDGKVSHAVMDNAKIVANLGLGYDVLSERNSLSAAFVGGGAAFTTQGIDPSPWLARGGLGFVMTTGKAVEVSARYDFEVRSSYDNQTGSIKVRVPF